MIGRIKSLEEVYNKCIADGILLQLDEIDKDLAKSLLKSANEGLNRSKKIEKTFEKETDNWAFTFAERYDILRKLIDVFLLFDKIKTSNHQCSNAYLCIKHPELEFDWNTLETIRLLRNDINYKGKIISEDVWNSFKLKFEIYISLFMKEVKKRLSDLE